MISNVLISIQKVAFAKVEIKSNFLKLKVAECIQKVAFRTKKSIQKVALGIQKVAFRFNFDRINKCILAH